MIADRREYTIRRVEYVIPSGARVAEVSEVWSVAMAEYRRLRGLPDDAEVPGDWVRVFAQDDAVVFRIEVREEPPSSGGVR